MIDDILAPGITRVEASAGTGKTFAITHRVLRLVAEADVAIQTVLVTTFGEAASAELADRIRARLREALLGLRCRLEGRPYKHPDPVLGAWLPVEPGEARIRIGRLERALIDFDRASISTIHAFANRVLTRFALRCGTALDAEVGAEARPLLDRIVTDFHLGLVYDAAPSIVPAIDYGGLNRKALLDLADKALTPGLDVLPDPVESPLPDLTTWQAAVAELQDAVAAAYVDRALWRWAQNPGLLKPVPKNVAGLRPANPRVDAALKTVLAEHAALSPPLQAWVVSTRGALVKRVRSQVPVWLRDAGQRTYDDLLVALARAVQDAELAATLRGELQLALVDEFQDTDALQWQVFRTLFSGRMALVGDPKQAIYSFRGADVHTYHRAVENPDHTEALDENFRTDVTLLKAVNHLYTRRTEPFGAPEPRFVASRPRVCDRLEPERAPLHIRFLPRQGGRCRKGLLEPWWLREQLPAIVAEDIAAELAAGTTIEGRPITAGDCAVLCRSNKEAALVQAALRQRGVPSVLRSPDSVLGCGQLPELLRVFEAVMAPTSTGSVRSALCTSLMGRSGGQLAALLADESAWAGQVEAFRSWNRLWVEQGFMPMFRAWLDDDDVLGRLLRAGDDRGVTDLLHLGELVHATATQQRLGPAGVLAWLRAGGPSVDAEQAERRLETDADAARVFTYHAAKGLEFGLVWCPFLWNAAFLHDNDKKHLRFYDAVEQRWRLDIGSPQQPQRIDEHTAEQLQEDLRLLYVALTRARHRLTLYWGPAGSTRSAVGYLLHGRASQMHDASLLADLDALAAEHPGITTDIVDWSWTPKAPDYRPDVGVVSVAARSFDRHLDTFWRRSSFSDLCRRDAHDHGDPLPAADRDAIEDDDDQDVTPSVGEAIVLAELVGGRRVGNLLHRILELHDFQDPGALAELTHAELQAHGFDADTWTEPVRDNLQQMLETPLGTGFCMADVPTSKRLNELEFTFPVRGGYGSSLDLLGSRQLAEVFDEPVRSRLLQLRFLPVRGFLHGFVDLIFEHEGRFWVVDWKSNKLGTVHTDYDQPSLSEAMLQSAYVLQYHLYTLALHRFLRARLGEEYDYDEHVGGVLYLFLRGMSPRWGADYGVFRDRPTRKRIRALEQVMRRKA